MGPVPWVARPRSAAWLGTHYRLRGTTPVYIGIGTIVVIVIIVLIVLLLRRGI
ncbi:MAG TPA: hypothetical protein VIK57_24975 [Streptosporangiaceae bacterium]